MTIYDQVNALGYPLAPDLPDTRPSVKRAADLLEKSVTRNVDDLEQRQLEALQGVGFALLAIAEQMAAEAQRPEEAPAVPRWFRRRHARTAIGAKP